VNGPNTFRVLAHLDQLTPTNVGLLDARDHFNRFSMHVGSDCQGIGRGHHSPQAAAKAAPAKKSTSAAAKRTTPPCLGGDLQPRLGQGGLRTERGELFILGYRI
jgi:hypothetical protein